MKKKTIVLIMSIALVACLSIGATLAFLSAKSSELVNTFTVGNIAMKLDEAKVSDNQVIDGRTDSGNSYRIYDSAVLPKDPTVTINAKSENCYVFMSCVVSDNIKDIASMNIGNNWILVKDNLYVYSKDGKTPSIVNYSDSETKLPSLFTNVKIADNCDWQNIPITGESIKVKSLAYQSNDSSTYDAAKAEAEKQLLG